MRTQVEKLFVITCLMTALTVFNPVSSQPAQTGRIFGAGHPFVLQDLPPSRLRSDLEQLPPQALQRAMENLHRFSFPAADAASLRVDKQGGVFYEDPTPPAPPAKSNSTDRGAKTSSPSVQQIVASVDTSAAFKLHSKPGASKVIYLNMAGAVVTSTIWNTNSGFATLYMRPYSQDSDDTTFTQSELNAIAETWKRIAEDFAPFDVDVTTEKPNSFGPNVGHILVTRKADAYGNEIYKCSCGGVAYVGVWGGSNYPYYQPALVFVDGVGTGPHNIAEAASHEMGHNLSLSHDGTASTGYYSGQGSGNVEWAPIMGVGYYAQVTQWSKGEYSGANNTQDDLSLIANRLSYRIDDHESSDLNKATPLLVVGTSVSSTTPVTDPDNLRKANKGIIEKRDDVDLFYVDVGAGTIDLAVTPIWLDAFYSQSLRGANLDIRATLYDSSGTIVSQSNPLSDTDARVTAAVIAGRYFLAVEGVGVGDPLTTGYSDYASLGQYFINGTVAASTLPVIQLNSATYSVNEGVGSVVITVTRSLSAESSSVNYSTANGSAVAGSDYTATSGVLTFAGGETTKTITIPILEDILVEGNENFTIALTSPSAAILGSQSSATITILDNDSAPATIQFGAASYAVTELRKSVSVVVTRSSGVGTAQVSFATVNGTALAGSDYTARSGTLTFNPGVTSLNIAIPIINDRKTESPETFSVELSNPNSAVLGSRSTVIVTISDK